MMHKAQPSSGTQKGNSVHRKESSSRDGSSQRRDGGIGGGGELSSVKGSSFIKQSSQSNMSVKTTNQAQNLIKKMHSKLHSTKHLHTLQSIDKLNR